MTTYWTSKTGNQVIYAARTLVNDTNPHTYAVGPETAITLYRHAVMDLIEEVGWVSDVRVGVPVGAGQYELTYAGASDADVLRIGEASWSRTGFIMKESPKSVRQRQEFDIQATGSVLRGDPVVWSLENNNAGIGYGASAVKILLYPAPVIAGTLSFYSLQVPTAVNDPAENLGLTRGMTQLLEVKLASALTEHISPENMQRRGLSPMLPQALARDYAKYLDREKARSKWSKRQTTVSLTRP
jgi:hypothetical protein